MNRIAIYILSGAIKQNPTPGDYEQNFALKEIQFMKKRKLLNYTYVYYAKCIILGSLGGITELLRPGFSKT